ncbi:hypothetical protein MmmBen181_0131 [Mycoplasma mycoides subsp. mycoides]|nr:hypothetical protein MmmBen181_0131 [Mycoplasma mycoides subsp. mycoides]
MKSTKYSDVLTFTFSNTLDLGKFKKENNAVSQLKVKKNSRNFRSRRKGFMTIKSWLWERKRIWIC